MNSSAAAPAAYQCGSSPGRDSRSRTEAASRRKTPASFFQDRTCCPYLINFYLKDVFANLLQVGLRSLDLPQQAHRRARSRSGSLG